MGGEMKLELGAVVALSGGMDSTTMLAMVQRGAPGLRQNYGQILAVGFEYPSKHNPYERRAAEQICQHYGVPYMVVDVTDALGCMKSNLLEDGGDIPEGHYEQSNMALTVVPGRNMIFASILSGIAWSRGLDHVFMGMHSGDHAIYPDCRPEFFFAMGSAIRQATEERVMLRAPLLNLNKTTILEWGLKNEVPYQLTRTCYKDQGMACGKCGACQERLEAFRNHQVTDPLSYEWRGQLEKAKG